MARLRHIGVLAAFLLAVGQIGVYGAGARSSSASAAAARMAPSTCGSSARRLPRQVIAVGCQVVGFAYIRCETCEGFG
jgi:hypothetical protein